MWIVKIRLRTRPSLHDEGSCQSDGGVKTFVVQIKASTEPELKHIMMNLPQIAERFTSSLATVLGSLHPSIIDREDHEVILSSRVN
jgi:hypothetical protein